jgi:hypothetical protein
VVRAGLVAGWKGASSRSDRPHSRAGSKGGREAARADLFRGRVHEV